MSVVSTLAMLYSVFRGLSTTIVSMALQAARFFEMLDLLKCQNNGVRKDPGTDQIELASSAGVSCLPPLLHTVSSLPVHTLIGWAYRTTGCP